MSRLEIIWNLKSVSFSIEIIKLAVIISISQYIYIKILNINNISVKKYFNIIISGAVISYITLFIKYNLNSYFSILILLGLLTIINTLNYKKNINYTLLMTILSLSIDYAIYGIAITIAFFPNIIFKIENDYISLGIIIFIFCFLIYNVFRLKKIKFGISFLKAKLDNSYFNILITNICVMILFLVVLLQNYGVLGSGKVGVTFVILSVIMFITIKQFLELYYKQNLLIKDLEETKSKLRAKEEEVNKLEKENLEFSKTSHSLAHKQEALEFKLERLINTNINEKNKESLKDEIKNLNQEIYKDPGIIELPKTEIEKIDNMFSYMQSECVKSNIGFELQILGNIHYMINNLISENDLEILIADHIKDAIIAINSSENTNRSILVRIGNIDNVYSLYVYDSGVEFEKEILDYLGKKPITTHANSGGTGMGFMNTFETLKKTKASLVINELGEPCEDNYTKVLMFKFDNQNEFKVESYKDKITI